MGGECWTIIGGMSTAIVALVAAVRVLWVRLEAARKEIVALHEQRMRELEEFKRMVEEKGRGHTQ